MRRFYRVYAVLYSWQWFNVLPYTYQLSENERHFKGFAFNWLGCQACFEELQQDGVGLKGKAESESMAD